MKPILLKDPLNMTPPPQLAPLTNPFGLVKQALAIGKKQIMIKPNK
jgi:hypothetical protein